MKVQILIVVLAAFVAITVSAPVESEEFGLKDTLELAKKYVKLIEKEGEKAWHFLECMGVDWAKDCVSPTLGCLESRDLPGCMALIKCEGKDAVSCAASFK